MLSKIWPILAAGFILLLGLTFILDAVSMRRAGAIYSETLEIHSSYQATEQALHDLRSDVFLSGILLRDYFLEGSPAVAQSQLDDLLEVRARVSARIDELVRSVPPQGSPLNRLQSEVDAYWRSVDPVFSSADHGRSPATSRLLRERALARREPILDIAEEIQSLNQQNLRRELERIRARHSDFQRYQLNLTILGLGLGLLVSGVSAFLVLRLDKRARAQQARTEEAEQELRRLSQRLVHLQEEERRSISRELHDQVGQMLTGVRLELKNLERRRDGSKEEFNAYLQETKKLIEETTQTVRDLAMGLRPSMLDDLGLEPALRWQVRDFSRRSGIHVSLHVTEELGEMPDKHRTCVYRVVQEALTNCAKHACAKNVDVHIVRSNSRLDLVIRDDGRGFQPDANPRKGLGLIGMEERARELGGSLSLTSEPGKGTILGVTIPMDRRAE